MFQNNAPSAYNPITYAKPAPNTYYITIILVQIAFEHWTIVYHHLITN